MTSTTHAFFGTLQSSTHEQRENVDSINNMHVKHRKPCLSTISYMKTAAVVFVPNTAAGALPHREGRLGLAKRSGSARAATPKKKLRQY